MESKNGHGRDQGVHADPDLAPLYEYIFILEYFCNAWPEHVQGMPYVCKALACNISCASSSRRSHYHSEIGSRSNCEAILHEFAVFSRHVVTLGTLCSVVISTMAADRLFRRLMATLRSLTLCACMYIYTMYITSYVFTLQFNILIRIFCHFQ